MSDFDPDAYLAAKTGAPVASSNIPSDEVQQAQFDPDAYLSSKQASANDALQAKAGGLGNQVQTGIENLGNMGVGLTPLLSRGLRSAGSAMGVAPENLHYLAPSPEELSAHNEANPWTANVAGAVGIGAGPLGEIGKGVSAGLDAAGAAPLIAKVAGYGLEGGAIGAGQSVDDYALGDPTLNAQKVLTNIGMGTVLGGGLGALSRAAEVVLPKGAERLAGALTDLKKSVLGSSDEPSMLVRGLSVPGGIATGQAPEDWAQKFYDGMTTAGVDIKAKTREFVSNLQKVHSSLKQAATDLYEKAAPANYKEALDDLGMTTEDAQKNASNVLGKIYDIVQPSADLLPGETAESALSPATEKLFAPILQDFEEKVSFPKSSDSAGDIHAALDQFAKDIDKGGLIKFDKLPTAAQQADQDILFKIRSAVRDNLKDPDAWGWAGPHYEMTTSTYADAKSALKDFQQQFMRKVPSTGKYEIDPSKSKTFFQNFNEVGQDFRKKVLNQFLKTAKDTADASESYAGFQAAKDSISSRISRLAKERSELRDIAGAIQKKPNESSKGILSELGFGAFAHTVGVPNPVIGATIAGVEGFKRLRNPYQLGATLGPTFDKLQAIGQMVAGVDQKIASLSKNILSPAKGAIATLAEASHGGFDKKVERIQELANNPETLMDHLQKNTAGIYEGAPHISDGIHSSVINSVQYLNSKVPRSANQLPISNDWKASNAQKQKFDRYYDAVNDPLSVMNKVKDGTLNSESMEALSATHPDLLDHMRTQIISRMDLQKAKDLPYSTRQSLSMFLGQPLESSQLPQVIQANQALLEKSASESTSPNTGPGKARSRPHQEQGMKVANRIATRSQKLESGTDDTT